MESSHTSQNGFFPSPPKKNYPEEKTIKNNLFFFSSQKSPVCLLPFSMQPCVLCATPCPDLALHLLESHKMPVFRSPKLEAEISCSIGSSLEDCCARFFALVDVAQEKEREDLYLWGMSYGRSSPRDSSKIRFTSSVLRLRKDISCESSRLSQFSSSSPSSSNDASFATVRITSSTSSPSTTSSTSTATTKGRRRSDPPLLVCRMDLVEKRGGSSSGWRGPVQENMDDFNKALAQGGDLKLEEEEEEEEEYCSVSYYHHSSTRKSSVSSSGTRKQHVFHLTLEFFEAR